MTVRKGSPVLYQRVQLFVSILISFLFASSPPRDIPLITSKSFAVGLPKLFMSCVSLRFSVFAAQELHYAKANK